VGRKGRDYDVIVVGAGHNALVSAAYLAQAGYHVAVFERRHIVGGAVATEEIVPGYRFDIGGSAHILIRLTPVVEELGLERYGLEYLEVDPLFFAPFPDGDSVFIHRSEERTIQGLEAKFPSQGEAYRRFLDDWRPFARMVRDAFLTVPGPLQLGRKVLFSRGMELAWKEALPRILRPYGDVLDEYFTEEKIRTPMVWMGAQSGPPPTEPLSAPFVLWHPLYHEGGIARPRGGSGMLTVALAAHVRDHGGEVHVDAPVRRILVEGRRAVGVEVDGRTYTARAVLSGAHAMETFGRLLPEEHVPDGARRMRAGNGFGVVLRLALDGPVRYTAHPGDEARVALQLLCRDRKQISAAYGDFLRGEPARDPPLVAMSFSAVDDTLAPPGHEVLWLWAQYFPYELADHVRPSGGEAGARGSAGAAGSAGSASGWDAVGEEVADTILDAFEAYAPGTRDRVVGRLFQHPLLLERELGLRRGNVMHLEMSLDQMFGMRPFLGMSGYRGHLKGLYITGASTHPGGGIMGASGRNAARVLLRDLERRRT
jgi:phytoene dehydrogenase-like protein